MTESTDVPTSFGAAEGAPLIPASVSVGVRVPASSANLGPGFDSLGLALGLYDEITVTVVDGTPGAVTVEVTGEAADEVPKDASHLVVRAIGRGLARAGCAANALHVKCHNRIPHSRGLGSSASAVVGGVAAAAALVAQSGVGTPLTVDAMVQLSSEFEGHPDNASASVLGSVVLSWSGDHGDYHARSLPVHPAIRAYALVPQVQSATAQMRGLLPDVVPRADAVFNISRVALLTHALTAEPGLLMTATQDRLHQNYRASALATSWNVVCILRDAGYAAMISGAGPTVLVLTDRQLDAATHDAVTSENFAVRPLDVAPGVTRFVVD